MRRALTIAPALFLAAACGIDAVGTGSPAPADSSGRATGDPVDPGPVGASLPAGSSCAVPAGWGVLAYAPSRATSCPDAWTSSDLVSDVVAEPGACSCSCTTSTADPPSCAKGNLQGLQGASTCTNTSVAYTISGTTCTSRGGTAYTTGVARYQPFPLYRGACTSAPAQDPSYLRRTDGRACVPDTPAVERLCNGEAPAGWSSCIAHDGDVPCPGAPFSNRVLAGSNASLVCGGCATCQNEASCGTTIMRYYDDSQCTSQVGARVLDDQCNALQTGVTGAAFTHFRYDVAMNDLACVASAAATTLTVEGRRTICCR
jgi:hypothetical protein